MRRFASAFAFLAMLAMVLASAGCGQRFDDLGAGTPPTEAQGSAHVVIETHAGALVGVDEMQVSARFEGDVSSSALVGDLTLGFPGGTLGGQIAMDEHSLNVRFGGQWYSADAAGIQDALAKVNDGSGPLLGELMSASGFGHVFDDLFTGEITEGPVVDGVATWQFDGRLDPDAVGRYVKEYGHDDLSANDRQVLEKVAETSHVVLVVGQRDHLPRKAELTLEPPKGLHFDSDLMRSTSGKFTLSLELSDFGKDVSFEAPKDAKPLSQLADQLFSAFE